MTYMEPNGESLPPERLVLVTTAKLPNCRESLAISHHPRAQDSLYARFSMTSKEQLPSLDYVSCPQFQEARTILYAGWES